MEDLTPQPKKSFVEALRGLMNEFRENKQTETEHTPKKQKRRGRKLRNRQRKRSGQRTQLHVHCMSKRHGHHKNAKEKENIQKEQTQTEPNTILCDQTCLSVISCNENKISVNDNQELVAHTLQTNPNTDPKRDTKEGTSLTFIPKPKKLNIHQLHNDIRLFMHRMKCKFELYHKPRKTKTRDSFEISKPRPYNPDRITDNGTLDTFLHRVRLEIINTNKMEWIT